MNMKETFYFWMSAIFCMKKAEQERQDSIAKAAEDAVKAMMNDQRIQHNEHRPPLCVNCVYHSKPYVQHLCGWRIDPVTGGPGGFADLERRYVINGSCGVNGKNFKPREKSIRFFN